MYEQSKTTFTIAYDLLETQLHRIIVSILNNYHERRKNPLQCVNSILRVISEFPDSICICNQPDIDGINMITL